MLRIQRIRIQVQVMNIYIRFTEFFNEEEFSNYFFNFSPLFLCNNLINHSEIRTFLRISLFSTVQIWVLRADIFWLIFLRIRIPEANMLRIQRIRILSTVHLEYFVTWNSTAILKMKNISSISSFYSMDCWSAYSVISWDLLQNIWYQRKLFNIWRNFSS